MLKNKSIGTKVSLFMAVIILVALVVTGVISDLQASNSLINQLDTNMQANAIANASVIASKIAIYKNDVQLTASRTRIQSLNWTQQQPVLKSDCATYGFESMAFTTTEGKLTKFDNTTADVTGREYFK